MPAALYPWDTIRRNYYFQLKEIRSVEVLFPILYTMKIGQQHLPKQIITA
jgi:hypothetical protein